MELSKNYLDNHLKTDSNSRAIIFPEKNKIGGLKKKRNDMGNISF